MEYSQQQQPQQDEVELGAPGGFRFRARSYDFLTIIILMIAVGLAWMMWQLRTDAQKEHEQVIKTQMEIVKTQITLEESVAEMVYVLTLSQADRDRLNLSMPQSLQKKRR